jgi:hypothetical protein
MRTLFLISIKLVSIATCLAGPKYNTGDSSEVMGKISFWMKSFKKMNKKQLYKYESPDSTIVFGSNKQKTVFTSVLVSDRKRNENRWYFYNETGVFRISIRQREKAGNSKERRKNWEYYFEGGELIYQVGKSPEHKPADLLLTANTYKEMAVAYLSKQ